MSAQAITKSATLKRAFSESVERDRRAFEIMAATGCDFFTAMQRVLDEEEKR